MANVNLAADRLFYIGLRMGWRAVIPSISEVEMRELFLYL